MNIFAVIFPDDEHRGDAVGLMMAARRLTVAADHAVHAIVVGSPGHARMAQVLLDAGAKSVLTVCHQALAMPVQSGQLLDLLLEALSQATDGCATDAPSLFLFAASPWGDELAASAAFRTGGTALGRCQDIERKDGQLAGSRTAFGGRVRVCLRALKQRVFACIRAGGTAPPAALEACAQRPGTLRELEITRPLPCALEATYEEQASRRQRVDAAKVVVSGGRGIGGAEGFTQLDALANALGGALAGSLPAVDAGWVPVSSQVGQSGNYVTPLVYVAVGISGTLQHLAGIGPEVRIVAINNDPEAHIFQEAQLGIVADWRAVVPLITARLLDGATARA